MTLPTQVNINIPQLFEDVFNVYARFPVYFLGNSKPGAPPRPAEMKEWELGASKPSRSSSSANKDHISPYGVPVWDRFGFKHPDISDSEEPIFYFPFATVAEVTMAKNMVLTPLIGRDGTVKELMSDGDHVITFRGFAINFDDVTAYPEKEVEQLNKLFALKTSLPIISKLLNNVHGITDIVKINKSWPSLEGYANVQPFEFIALSDTNIVLDLSAQ